MRDGKEDQRQRSRRVWLYLTAAIYGLTFWYHPAHDPDLGWHLAGGAWIADHRALPSYDFVNSFNPFWHDYHWLGQLALYGIYCLGHYQGLRLALGLLLAYLATVVLDIVLLESPRRQPMAVTLAAFFGAMALIGHVVSVRPQMLSLCLVALAVRRLIQRAAAWELPYLLGLTVVLVNVHVYWALIPALWFFYRCAPRFTGSDRFGAAYAWGGAVLLSGAGLISPYGLLPFGFMPPSLFMNYALLWDYFTMPAELKTTIGEFRGALATEGFTPWLILLYVIVVARTFSWRRLVARIGAGLSAVVFVLLAIGSLKFVAVFAVAGLPYFVRQLQLLAHVPLGRVRRWERPVASAIVALVLLGAAVHAARHFPWLHDNDEYITAMLPVAACRHITTLDLSPRPPREHLRVLTHFNHGGWCRWILYQQRPDLDFRVTTDGRTQWVPAEHFLRAYDVMNVKNDWLNTLKRWGPDVLVIPATHALGNVLALDPKSYQLVFRDESFLVFVPLRQ
ncbi:MAG: hypothetical protein HY699_07230 [Deltaproteobacteria bacterium]|nr:hypothetical protein [Deltaproteobacteria bacterium]